MPKTIPPVALTKYGTTSTALAAVLKVIAGEPPPLAVSKSLALKLTVLLPLPSCVNTNTPDCPAVSLLTANEVLIDNIENEINGNIEDNVNVNGHIYLGENSIIKSGTYIDGNVWIVCKKCN